MTTFTDGPAAGAELTLRRAPLLLRVVQGPDGTWDALDQLADEPRPNEAVHAYRRVGAAGVIHVDYRDSRGRRAGSWQAWATYAVVAEQPDDATVRSTEAWRAWCVKQGAAAAAATRPPGPQQRVRAERCGLGVRPGDEG